MKIKNLSKNGYSSCTGCHACFSVCPNSAITMTSDSEGFIFPEINSEKCVQCGLCEKVCPVLLPLKNKNENTLAFAAVNNNTDVRLDSSSGGIFTALAEKIIEENGLVFGAKFAEDFSVIHSWTDSLNGLTDFRGSKYLQSVIGDSYKECKSFLEKNKKVLFTGTPCQIQGLKKYLGKEYDNLFTVDFICHGIPSPLLWKKYREFREIKSGSKVSNAFFRKKNPGWKRFSLELVFKNACKYSLTLDKDPYMQLFLKDVALRESCYQCSFRELNRPSDITLADFWGIQNLLPEMDDDRGTSFILIHSDKGKKLFEKLEQCDSKEINVLDGARYNHAIKYSPVRPEKRNVFYKDINNKPFEIIIKKYACTPLYMRSYRFIRRFAGQIKKFFTGGAK